MTELRTDTQQIAIVGAGKAGRSIAAAAREAGLRVALFGREREQGALSRADVVLICTGDAEIEAVAGDVATEVPPHAIVGHVSGATPLAALSSAVGACAGGFSLHPLQTIPAAGTPLTGVPCAISATTPAASERAHGLAVSLGMEPFAIAEEDRAAYHAAATIASNFLFALEESAAALLAATGVTEARETLAPLVLASAANWAEHGATALTGPIARGDEETSARHLDALAERAPELLELYQALAARTRELASSPEGVT
jgi:predicted short-subunit dehydrogenase-like oxidoreductase (DUF2520 family)